MQAPLSDFLKTKQNKTKTLLVPRNSRASKKRNGVITCHCNSNVNKAWIITTFYLNIVQLWTPLFSDIFINAELVNALSGEVYPLKYPVEPPGPGMRQAKVNNRLVISVGVTPGLRSVFKTLFRSRFKNSPVWSYRPPLWLK